MASSDFRYKPQVDLSRVVEHGEGWLNNDETPLIRLADLYDINEIISSGRKCEFTEGRNTFVKNEAEHIHYWLRWFHVPMSYLISLDVFDSLETFLRTKDQLSRYLHYLKTVVYPTYRKNDDFVEWGE